MQPGNQKPEEFFQQTWSNLSNGLNKVLNLLETHQSLVPKEWLTYHDACYAMCCFPDENFKMPDKLYPRLAELLGAFVETRMQRLKDKSGEILLKEYLTAYSNYCTASSSIRKILAYLHRFWIPSHRNETIQGIQVRETVPLSLVIWRQKCWTPLKNQITKAVLELIHNERSNVKVDMTLVRRLLQSYESDALGIDDKGFYDREFESHFLDATKVFYVTESTAFIEENGVSSYMQKAEGRIENEQNNAKQYLLASTEPKLKAALNESLISKHMDTIQSSFQGFLKDERHEDMRRVYFLLSRISDGLNHTAKTFEEYLKAVGSEIVETQRKRIPKDALANANAFIKTLIDLHKKYTELLGTCFSNHTLFKSALDKAFTEVINKNTGKWPMPRLLTLFVDHILKGKEKETSSDHEIEETLDAVVSLFSYLVDKDEFEEMSRKALCKRLLSAVQSFNEAWERSFVTKLKARQGDAFTRKLQGMFTDAQDDTVKRTREKFETYNGGPRVEGVQLQVQVLNECFWPLSAQDKLKITGLPAELASCITKFDAFYKHDTSNRRLNWIYTHGTVQMNANYGRGKLLQFILTPFQASIILLFNSQEHLTFQEILNQLWPDAAGAGRAMLTNSGNAASADVKLDQALKFAIGPLYTGGGVQKFKVFTKDGEKEDEGKEPVDAKKPAAGDAVKAADKFTVVEKIGVVKRKRIVFPPGNMVAATEKDDADDKAAIMKQREFEADAAMVRVMKTRNVLKWVDLQIQTVEALKNRFKPETVLLKKRLESLIDRKFLERDPNDRNLIKYVA